MVIENKFCKINNYLTFEIKTLFKINPEDLAIYPQFMSEDRIKEIIINEIDYLYRSFLEQDFIKPVSYEVNLIGVDSFSEPTVDISSDKT